MFEATGDIEIDGIFVLIKKNAGIVGMIAFEVLL